MKTKSTRRGKRVTVLTLGHPEIVCQWRPSESVRALLARIKVEHHAGDSIFQNGKRVALATKVEPNDVFCLIFPIQGGRRIRCDGRQWKIHKNDADPHPSNFHAHNYPESEVLDLTTGLVYDAFTRKKIRKFPEKCWKFILDDLAKCKELEFRRKSAAVLSAFFAPRD